MEMTLKQRQLQMLARLARRVIAARGRLSETLPCAVGHTQFVVNYHRANRLFEWYVARLEKEMK